MRQRWIVTAFNAYTHRAIFYAVDARYKDDAEQAVRDGNHHVQIADARPETEFTRDAEEVRAQTSADYIAPEKP